MLRQIAAMHFPDLTPAEVASAPPVLRLVAPDDLCVDETYQRNLSERSVRLIRKIVKEWQWRAFKPPVVVETDGRLEVIDGQHTAIAAATHGGIPKIPVLVVDAGEPSERAGAFVRHNRDRIAVTATQLHNALVAAGDDDALTLDSVCRNAGVKVLRYPPSMGRFKVGETLAVGAISSLIRRRFPVNARKVLEVCVAMGMAPVSSDMIKAVEHLLFAKEYAGEITGAQVVRIAEFMGPSLANEAQRFAAERSLPIWRGLASVIFMNRKRVRNVA